jgi:FkbM family methyltransferase
MSAVPSACTVGHTALDRIAASASSSSVVGRTLRAVRTPVDDVLMKVAWPPLSAQTPDGRLRGYLRHRSVVSHVGRETGSFAWQVFLERVEPGCTVIDGGAHIGLYTLAAASRVGARGQVYAFEADPYNFAALAVNARRLSNVRLANKALAGRRGVATFFASSGTIGSSLFDRGDDRQKTPVSIETTTVDAELAARPRDHVAIKIDVEGAEEQVLRGAHRTLTQSRTAVVLAEHHPVALRYAGSSSAAMVAALESCGLVPYFISETDRRLVPVSAARPPTVKGNLLAEKSSVTPG